MLSLGLIGLHIAHSRAPALISLLGELSGLPVTYRLYEPDDASPDAFARTLQSVRAQGLVGCNVTYPFKQIALRHVQVIPPSVATLGAVNTLHFQNANISATNTDYSGFIRGFQARFPNQAAGSVVMLGAGGVGRAVGFGLQAIGAQEVAIYDVNTVMADDLVQALTMTGLTARRLSAEEVQFAAHQADGLINCTPIGHDKTPGNPLPPECFVGQRWVFDAVYVPLDTDFLLMAAAHGSHVMSGFDLFLYQGLDAFTVWTGLTIDPSIARRAFQTQYSLHSAFIS